MSEADAQTAAAGPLVFLIDDDRLLLDVARLGLEGQGYTVETAASGAEAIAKLTGVTPALVVLDLEMPRMSGLAVLERLKGHRRLKDVPVIVVTASALGVDAQAALRLGAARYLLKPMRPEELVKHISSLIG